MKKWALILLSCYFLTQFAEKQTDGFTFSKISNELPSHSFTPVPAKYLEKKYKYLAKGAQCYVFESLDGETVLKFFRCSKQKNLEALSKILPISSIEKKLERQKALFNETISSYNLAFEKLREETALLGLHFSKTGPITLQIIDKLGIQHTIDGSKYPFVVQRKAVLVRDKVDEWMKEGQVSQAKQGLINVLKLTDKKANKGIEDFDPNLSKNFGFVEDKPVQIDAGRFLMQSPSRRRLEDSKKDLLYWLNAHHPELSEVMQ